ncbi:MAG: DNA replication/repair protein RecF [Chloroflexi bacterium]|nr:DNA replication/repair protein RecF [Chloroflexota bacterium]
MHLTRLALTHFRNYAHLELDLAPGVTVIQGDNACGKTSLLEAIFYLATARSPHAGAERELIRWGASAEPIPFARVETQIERSNGARVQIEIVLIAARAEEKPSPPPAVGGNEGGSARKPNGRVSKRIKVNGVSKRAIDLLGELNAVLFLPEDLDLVFGSPGDRRRYLDTTLAQIDPRYGRALSKYDKVVEQRNGLLREFRERAYNPHALDIWDRQLIEEGTYLVARRAETIARYNQLVADIHARLTDQREQLRLVYQPSVAFDLATSQESRHAEIARNFARQLETLRPRELSAALTLVGPHRDDLRFLVTRNPSTVAQDDAAAMDATTYASRGQGRTIALALKLAEVALMRAETGEDPVLLLDDVMSELDAARRGALAQAVLDASQAIITATDLEDFAPEFLERARVLKVCDGSIG